MTDNGVVQTLESIIRRYKDVTHYVSCIVDINILKKAINLINHQKEENKRLEKEAKDKERAYNDEFCLRKEWQAKCRELLKEKQIIKSEAIKEFAEEIEYFILNEDVEIVKPKCKYYGSYINGANQFRHQIKNGIKKLVKEMTEVEE